MKRPWLAPALCAGALSLTYLAGGAVERVAREPAVDRTVARAHVDDELSMARRQAVWAECELLYDDLTIEEIEAELDSLRQAIREDAAVYYNAQFAAGAFEVEGTYQPGLPYRVDPVPDELSSRRMLPDGTVGKVVLPEEEFPETYELVHRAQWLQSHKLGRSMVAPSTPEAIGRPH